MENSTYYTNDGIAIKTSLQDNKIHGKQKHYYKDGNLRLEIPYKNGNIDGEMVSYYRNGNVKRKIFYENNKRNRVYYYLNNGELEGIMLA